MSNQPPSPLIDRTMCVAGEWQRDGRGLWAERRCQYYQGHGKPHEFGPWRYNVQPPTSEAALSQQPPSPLLALVAKWRANADMLAEGNKSDGFDPSVGMQLANADELEALLTAPRRAVKRQTLTGEVQGHCDGCITATHCEKRGQCLAEIDADELEATLAVPSPSDREQQKELLVSGAGDNETELSNVRRPTAGNPAERERG